MGLAFIGLKEWTEREAVGQSVSAIAGRAFGAFSQFQETLAFRIVPLVGIEHGNVSGFDFYLQPRCRRGGPVGICGRGHAFDRMGMPLCERLYG